jgi:hypothetical protein
MQQQWRLLLADRSERNRATQYKHSGPDMNVIVVFFLLVDSPASEFYAPTFWNTLFHLDRWNRVFRNVGTYNSDAAESPNKKNTTFRTRRKFEIKNELGYFDT